MSWQIIFMRKAQSQKLSAKANLDIVKMYAFIETPWRQCHNFVAKISFRIIRTSPFPQSSWIAAESVKGVVLQGCIRQVPENCTRALYVVNWWRSIVILNYAGYYGYIAISMCIAEVKIQRHLPCAIYFLLTSPLMICIIGLCSFVPWPSMVHAHLLSPSCVSCWAEVRSVGYQVATVVK